MKARPVWEILIGSAAKLDWLAEPEESTVHPLQSILEEFVETQLDEESQELYLMRYGEQLPIRVIAKRMGYNSHQVIQVKLQRIEDKCKEWIDEKMYETWRNSESS